MTMQPVYIEGGVRLRFDVPLDRVHFADLVYRCLARDDSHNLEFASGVVKCEVSGRVRLSANEEKGKISGVTISGLKGYDAARWFKHNQPAINSYFDGLKSKALMN